MGKRASITLEPDTIARRRGGLLQQILRRTLRCPTHRAGICSHIPLTIPLDTQIQMVTRFKLSTARHRQNATRLCKESGTPLEVWRADVLAPPRLSTRLVHSLVSSGRRTHIV